MRWPRIAKVSATLAVLAAIALCLPPIFYWFQAELRHIADAPKPIVATSEETRAILATVLERKKFAGVPPPPPEPGRQAPHSVPPRTLILGDQSLCISEVTATSSCEPELTDSLLNPQLGSIAPEKLRKELAIANQQIHPLSLEGIPQTKVVSTRAIEQIFSNNGWWPDFYSKYPGTAGFARISIPVLTADKQQALIYISFHCDGLCGTGTLLLLERLGTGWRVTKEALLWIS